TEQWPRSSLCAEPDVSGAEGEGPKRVPQQLIHLLTPRDSSWFNEAWLQGISDDPGPNRRLKVTGGLMNGGQTGEELIREESVNNLKTILQSLVEYSQDVLGHPILEQHLPDVSLIGEFSDPEELGKLLQLVLGCAISCEKKQGMGEHIQRIMTLEESVQHVVMEAIQELMTKDTSDSLSPETYGNFDSQLRLVCMPCPQLVLLSEEKQSLVQENEVLRERVGRSEGEGATGLTAKKLLLLQSQLEQLQEENFRLESGREDERVRCAELEREVAELQQRNQELTSLAQEAQALKDEMDELRIPASTECLVQELQGQRQEEAMKAEKWLFECRNLEEKYELVSKEKEPRSYLRSSGILGSLRALAPLGPASAHPQPRPQYRLNQQQLSELRAQVEDLQKALQEQGGKTEDSTLLKRKLEEHLQKLHEADLELQRKREYIEELEPPADSSTARRIEELQHNLQKKDADLRAMEERYRRYVDKARTVIQTLEPKQRPPGGALPDLHTLRTQLRERDVRIRHLEMDFEKSRSQREQEEKLLISAWYNMGMALQQRAGEERAPAHAQSFLAQQRLATNARRGPLGRLAPLNMRPSDKH
ncbi:hypothetical protein E2I00_001651, partial [Balaenoptera physalus]